MPLENLSSFLDEFETRENQPGFKVLIRIRSEKIFKKV
jgi:hypothetical protein